MKQTNHFVSRELRITYGSMQEQVIAIGQVANTFTCLLALGCIGCNPRNRSGESVHACPTELIRSHTYDKQANARA
jgi:hypothetical protein